MNGPTRRQLGALAAAAALALLASCGGGGEAESLTLEQKVGQLVMMGVDGTGTEAPGVQAALAQIRAGELGGVILYRYNITGPQQVQALNRALAEANPLPYPLLLALDQEGGLVQRLRASNGFFDTIQERHSEREAVVRALLAGNDLLVFSNNPAAAVTVPGFRPRYDLGRHVAALVREAIARGELTEARTWMPPGGA